MSKIHYRCILSYKWIAMHLHCDVELIARYFITQRTCVIVRFYTLAITTQCWIRYPRFFRWTRYAKNGTFPRKFRRGYRRSTVITPWGWKASSWTGISDYFEGRAASWVTLEQSGEGQLSRQTYCSRAAQIQAFCMRWQLTKQHAYTAATSIELNSLKWMTWTVGVINLHRTLWLEPRNKS